NMPQPMKFVPEKFCLKCGKKLVRPRFKNGKLESRQIFLKKKYCSSACACSYRNVNDPPIQKNAYHKQARKLRGNMCEACGIQKKLQVHHVDHDYQNNDPSNLQTLCMICHNYWHRVLNQLGKKNVGRMPKIM